ncbi:MAG TPA: YcnI family protein [Thermoleophilaceae bacterium]|nr:YcnI family protein [Thermoleophilaceae bacterium]
MRFKTTFAAALAASLTAAAPAAAHVTIAPGEGPADGYATVQVQVPHGCDGSPTKAVRVQIPASVPSVTPQVHPGWDVSTKEGPKDAVELHGETVTTGVEEVVWTAADAGPLPDGRLDIFGMSVKLPAGKAGDAVYFPTVQQCVKGKEAWIQIPQQGESPDDLESPAPAVVLTASEDEHGSSASAEHEAGSTAEASDDDGPSAGLAIAALVLGGFGLLTGVVALSLILRKRT